MKKFYSILFAILLLVTVTGLAEAHSLTCDPVTGPCQVKVSVYNNSSSALDAGDVVIWDMGIFNLLWQSR